MELMAASDKFFKQMKAGLVSGKKLIITLSSIIKSRKDYVLKLKCLPFTFSQEILSLIHI